MLQEKVFWWTTAEFPTGEAEPPGGRWDVAVVGGGYTGLAAALWLARHGARVAVLETHTIGWGASSRNGGQVLTGLKLGIETLFARYGRDLARRLFAASLSAIDCVEQIVRDENIACGFARRGHLEVACKPAHFEHFRRTAELLAREFNHVTRLVEARDLHNEIGSDVYHGGLVDEASAGVNPAQYVAGLGRAAQAAGAKLFERAPVTGIERQARARFRLVTARGVIEADQVLIATGGLTGRATPALQRRVVPIGSYIIATEPLPESLAGRLLPQQRVVFDSKNFLHYFRLSADRRLLFGGRAAFAPETPDTVRESAAILRRDMVAVFPQLREARVEYAWGGTLDFAFDLMPHAGRHQGLYFALGYAGHGVALATYLGTRMAETICGLKVDNPFAEIAFPGAPLGLYDGRPWFLPLAEKWYRFLDWVS
ncbi:MAG: FAD-binding oxidoreductase [Anaerolineales bacterium]|nr:FAD-binding oxidoreductase [Anaerolineales bacterium]